MAGETYKYSVFGIGRMGKVHGDEAQAVVTVAQENLALVRNLGGALFCDRPYDKVFVYYNGAESYYAARGFRGSLRV